MFELNFEDLKQFTSKLEVARPSRIKSWLQPQRRRKTMFGPRVHGRNRTQAGRTNNS